METKELVRSPLPPPDSGGVPRSGETGRTRPSGKRMFLYIRLALSAIIFIAAVVISSAGGGLSIKLSEFVAILNSGGDIDEVFEAIGRMISGDANFDEIISALMPAAEKHGGSGEIWERVEVPEGMELVPYTN
jgi:hypothetical protein